MQAIAMFSSARDSFARSQCRGASRFDAAYAAIPSTGAQDGLQVDCRQTLREAVDRAERA